MVGVALLTHRSMAVLVSTLDLLLDESLVMHRVRGQGMLLRCSCGLGVCGSVGFGLAVPRPCRRGCDVAHAERCRVNSVRTMRSYDECAKALLASPTMLRWSCSLPFRCRATSMLEQRR